MSQRRLMLYVLAGITLIFLAMRVAGFPDAVIFRGDQGIDMLVVRAMDQEGLRPSAGALLSVDAIAVPPTFYYISWFFYRLTGSYAGVYAGTILLSAVTYLFLVSSAWLLAGPVCAVIAALLLAASDIFYFQSLALWDPVPGMAFLAAAIFFYLLSLRRKNAGFLWTAAGLYAVSMSVYPGPIILLPVAALLIYRWYRRNGYRKGPSAMRMLLIIGLTILPSVLPRLTAEYRTGWPTLVASASQTRVAGADWLISMKLLGENLLAIAVALLPVHGTLQGMGILTAFMVCTAFLWRHSLIRRRRRINLVLAGMAVVGLLPVLLYRGPPDSHRMWAYLPIFIICLSYWGFDASRSKSVIIRITAVLALLLYISVNSYALRMRFVRPYRQLSLTRNMAKAISDDLSSRRIPPADTSFAYETPDGEDSNELKAIWYWMREDSGFPVPLAASGNTVLMDRLVHSGSTFLYQICESSYVDIRPGSWCPEARPNYQLAKQIRVRPGYTVTVFVKYDVSVPKTDI